jgi:hypothetical protein
MSIIIRLSILYDHHRPPRTYSLKISLSLLICILFYRCFVVCFLAPQLDREVYETRVFFQHVTQFVFTCIPIHMYIFDVVVVLYTTYERRGFSTSQFNKIRKQEKSRHTKREEGGD